MAFMRYGEGTLYGAAGVYYGEQTITTRTITWGVIVDWDDDGTFTGENEATGRLQGLRLRQGREFIFNSSSDGLQYPDAGTLELDMLDTNGRYDPYNTDSPLSGYLYKNQKIQVVIKSETSSTTYPVFTGRIADIRPDYGSPQRAIIYVDGEAVRLNTKIKSTVYTNVQYDAQISAALTLAGWTNSTDIDSTGSDQMAYHWFSNTRAISEIEKIAEAAFGLFWISEDGTAVYRGRINPDVSTQSITESDIDYSYRIQIPAPRDVLRNRARVYARPRTAVTNAEGWRMLDKPLIAAGTGDAIWADFTYNGESVPATSVTSPVATTDFTANDAQDGSGTNRTANFSFSTTAFSTTAKLIPTNSGVGAYLTLLKIRANIITTDKYTFAEYEDADSILAYGDREFTMNTDWLQDLNTANEYAQVFVSRFKNPRAFPRFKFKRSSIDKQFTTGLFEMITVNFNTFGVTGEFRTGYMERSWSINEPNVIDSIYYLEPNTTAGTGDTWVFPMTFPTVFP